MWVTGVATANEIAPEGLGATAQGLFSGVFFGLAGVIGGLTGGVLYENLGAVMMFRWAGMIGLVLALPLLLYQYTRARPPSTYQA
jgi:PPP family 3-phenylpropionic acid transporter